MSKTLTGGCQCGRVRYAATIESDGAYLCHCRMCQRAPGGYAAAFVNLRQAALEWRGAPDWYQSSPIPHRPFCPACGTPLGIAFLEGPDIDLTLGSFDDPSRFAPAEHSGAEFMHAAWLDTAALLRRTSVEPPSVANRWNAAALEVPE
jgi:hypothetical protein